MFVFRTTSRARYARACKHFFDHPEKYEVLGRGRDYGADLKDRAAGCSWYIHYLVID